MIQTFLFSIMFIFIFTFFLWSILLKVCVLYWFFQKTSLNKKCFSGAVFVLYCIDFCTLFYYSLYLLFCLCFFQILNLNAVYLLSWFAYNFSYPWKNAFKAINFPLRTAFIFFHKISIVIFSLPISSKCYATYFRIFFRT